MARALALAGHLATNRFINWGNERADNPFRRLEANKRLFQLGRRLREHDDAAEMPRYKRRRIGRRARRTKRKSAFAGTTSSAAGRPNALGFRTKRRSLRSYRRSLWNAGLNDTHWRSAGGAEFALTLTTAGSVMDIRTPRMVPVDFWQSGGGFTGTGTFNDTSDFTIRGGLCKLMLENDAATKAVYCTVWLIYFTSETDSPSFPTTATIAWDPSLMESHRDFKVIGRRHIELQPGGTATMNHRLTISRNDQDSWVAGYKQMYWVLGMYHGGADAVTFRYSITHNLSFTMDHN